MTRIAILGYGNLGRGVEAAVAKNADQQLVAIFTRRDPSSISPATEGLPVLSVDEIQNYVNQIDVLMLCGGSATDLPEQTKTYARLFNVVDSFDTHKHIPQHFAEADEASKAGGKISVISCGWDPGLFSLARTYFNAVLPDGTDYTFWGRGVSQGHSDAIRRIAGVVDARQYTVPVPEALEAVRSGECPTLTTRQKHTRECYVVAEEGADLARIEREIKTMPNYFDEYDTTVEFITLEELRKNHSGIPHGGFVIRNGKTGKNDLRHTVEFRLQLESNPEFTGSVLAACARAAHRMNLEGQCGCKTILDIPPAYLSPESAAYLRAHLL